jgi:hypothetical protein
MLLALITVALTTVALKGGIPPMVVQVTVILATVILATVFRVEVAEAFSPLLTTLTVQEAPAVVVRMIRQRQVGSQDPDRYRLMESSCATPLMVIALFNRFSSHSFPILWNAHIVNYVNIVSIASIGHIVPTACYSCSHCLACAVLIRRWKHGCHFASVRSLA